MTSLAVRSRAEEQMDADDLPPDTYAAVLADLSRVNVATFAARPTLAFLDRIAAGRPSLRILDVGFGHGDMLRRIARWGTKRGIALDLVGVDLNPRSAPVAAAATPADLCGTGPRIDWRTGDYRDYAAEPWDAVLSSLVAHHMTDEQLVAFLRFMERHARAGWLVNDLHRHRMAHAGYPWLARLLRTHRIVREDGTLSIARAFRPREWAPLLAAAGVSEARVERWFPFRLCVSRVR